MKLKKKSASVESFLYQVGYLTIKKIERNEFVICYPNEEVRSSLADMYLDDVCHIEGYVSLGNAIWKALEDENIENLVKPYNLLIAGLPYDYFSKKEDKLLNEIKEEKKVKISLLLSKEKKFRGIIKCL